LRFAGWLLPVLLSALPACSGKKDAGTQAVPSVTGTTPTPGQVVPPQSCTNCGAPDVCVDGTCVAGGSPVLETVIGDGPGELGVTSPEEDGETFGPMSFAARDDGFVAVLDQENKRIIGFRNNAPELEIALTSGTYEDVVFFDDQHLALLDLVTRPRIDIVDFAGKITQTTSLLDESQAVTVERLNLANHLARRPDGVWLSFFDNHVIQYLTDEGKPATGFLRTLEHHLTGNGVSLAYGETRDHMLYVAQSTRKGRFVERSRQLEIADFVMPTLLLDSDARGYLYALITQSPSPNTFNQHMYVFDEQLVPKRDFQLQTQGAANVARNRGFAVSPKGDIYVISQRDGSIEIDRY
jgi:hypothetical protein